MSLERSMGIQHAGSSRIPDCCIPPTRMALFINQLAAQSRVARRQSWFTLCDSVDFVSSCSSVLWRWVHGLIRRFITTRHVSCHCQGPTGSVYATVICSFRGDAVRMVHGTPKCVIVRFPRFSLQSFHSTCFSNHRYLEDKSQFVPLPFHHYRLHDTSSPVCTPTLFFQFCNTQSRSFYCIHPPWIL